MVIMITISGVEGTLDDTVMAFVTPENDGTGNKVPAIGALTPKQFLFFLYTSSVL